MLLVANYTFREGMGEEGARRANALFVNWTPPDGFEFKAHYQLADGNGGLAIIEADSAEAGLRAAIPFAPYIEFNITPIVDIADAIGIQNENFGYWDSIS
jgi:hypothetical protein